MVKRRDRFSAQRLPSALRLRDPQARAREGGTAQQTWGVGGWRNTNRKSPNGWSPGKQAAESGNWYFSSSAWMEPSNKLPAAMTITATPHKHTQQLRKSPMNKTANRLFAQLLNNPPRLHAHISSSCQWNLLKDQWARAVRTTWRHDHRESTVSLSPR